MTEALRTPRVLARISLGIASLALWQCALPHAVYSERDVARDLAIDGTSDREDVRREAGDVADAEELTDGADAEDASDATLDVLDEGDARDAPTDADVVLTDTRDAGPDALDVATDSRDASDASDAREDAIEAGIDATVPPDVVPPDAAVEAGADSATPDAGLPVRCADLAAAARMQVVTLYAGATSWRAYCDYTAPNGPWTLVAKVEPGDTNWDYTSARWSDTSLVNESRVTVDRESAKYLGFNTLSFTRARLVFVTARVLQPDQMETVDFAFASGARSLREIFMTGSFASVPTMRTDWTSLVPLGFVQSNCGEMGFNAQGRSASSQRVRIGIIGNNETNCSSPDSWLGVGGISPTGALEPTITAGNRSDPLGVNFRRTPSHVQIWLR